ncbi:MAG: Resolvase protein [Microgenomates group bacterium Gr01-1014_7]|nr:MAG: Resolvase protein [Microgenomates group bacterium Gr01-1014_7]
MNTADFVLTYGAYSRRSSEDYEDRQVASIESQERELKEVKERLNLNVKQLVSESRSAHTIGRPVFNQLLADLEDGVINAILTYHPNRLCRNAFDAGRLIYLMDEGKLLEIRTPSRVFKNTPEDKFMLNLEFGISKKDSDDKSVVVKRGLRNKIELGWRPGVAPHGYLNDRATESGHRRILIDPERFEFIKQIFQLKYKGVPTMEILRIVNEDWKFKTRPKKRYPSEPLSCSSLYKLLGNPFYCGKYFYSGQWHEGAHEKAVEPDIFDQIQIMLGDKGCRRQPKTHEFAYTGMVRCGECSGMVTAEEKWQIICSKCRNKFALTRKNSSICPECNTLIEEMDQPRILYYSYYHCGKKIKPCSQKSIEVTDLEEQIQLILGSIEISDFFLSWAVAEIHKDLESEKDFREDKVKSVQRAHEECRSKLDNLLKLKISPLNSDGSLMSDEKFKTEKQALETELTGLEKQLNEVDNRMIQKAQEAVDKFDFAANAKARFETDDLAVKREILSTLGSNLTLKDKKLDLQPHPILNAIKKIREEEPKVSRGVEPSNQPFTKAQMDAFYSSNITVLRGRESNPLPQDYALNLHYCKGRTISSPCTGRYGARRVVSTGS